MTIGLYDIDFYHSSKFTINLELMKMYNYFLKQGHQVVFLRPNDNFGRCTKIIFFKERVDTKIPKTLNLTGENKIIHGYGFFKNFSPIDIKAINTPPSFLPYELYFENIKNKKLFTKIKNNSIIRIENQDISYFYKDRTTIFIADHVLTEEGLQWLFSNYSNYKIDFLYSVELFDGNLIPLLEKSLSTMQKPPRINFDYSCNFFKANSHLNLRWNVSPKKNETNLNLFIERFLKMILWLKRQNKSLKFSCPSFSQEQLKKYPILSFLHSIIVWARIPVQESFIDFIKTKTEKEKLFKIVNDKANLRLLIKQKPISFSEELDF